MADINVHHGIDGDPQNDAEKAAALGGLGGAAVGAAAGSVTGPAGTLVGAVVGGLIGAGASGAAVAVIDEIDDDATLTGVPPADTLENTRTSGDAPVPDEGLGSQNLVTGQPVSTHAGTAGLALGAVAGGIIRAGAGGPVGALVGGALGAVSGRVVGDAVEAVDDAEAQDRHHDQIELERREDEENPGNFGIV